MSSKQYKIGLFYLCLAIFLLFGLIGCSSLKDVSSAVIDSGAETLTDALQPNPDLTPEDVVRIQVEALQSNDSEDTGIEIAFRFASPDNRQITGPLHRFVNLVKNPAYRPMLNHKEAEYDAIEISDDTAQQRVTIIGADGSANVYLFELSKHDTPSCDGCWMTDSVSFVPTRRQNMTGA
ncbi:MAG: DUF4864 domain-containing protein [Anaerolineae bacterium]|nr:DUF4864 domain-containing protein [Anaerolineae bacterium]